jgi:hypothetical protein
MLVVECTSARLLYRYCTYCSYDTDGRQYVAHLRKRSTRSHHITDLNQGA